MNNKPNQYEVGYCKPPLRSRFQVGHSGNPKGRPKQAKGFRTILHEQLEAPVDVRVDGQAKRITKREAMIAQQINKAAMGDPRSAELLLLKLNLLERDWHGPGNPNGLDPKALEQAKLIVRGRLV